MSQPSTHTSGPLCPECATPSRALPTRCPWVIRARRPLQFTLLIVTLAFVGWQNWQNWTPLTLSRVVQPQFSSMLFYPKEPFTRADVVAIAEGTSNRRFTSQLEILDHAPQPEDELAAIFINPAGMNARFQSYGCPLPFLRYRWLAEVEDVYNPDVVTRTPTTMQTRWSELSRVSYALDHRGARRTQNIDFDAMCAALLVLLLAWTIATPLLALMRRCSFARKCSPLACRLLRPILLVATVIIIAALSLRPDEMISRTFQRGPPQPHRTGITMIEARSLASDPRGEATLARAILAAADGDGVLAFGTHMSTPFSTEFGRGGWPSGWLSSSRSIWSGPTADPFIDLRREYTNIQLTILRTGPHLTSPANSPIAPATMALSTHTVRPAPLAFLLLFLWLAWFAGALPTLIARISQHRRQTHRLQNTQCLHCGYHLRGLPT